jgi:hypothetical protein
MKQIIYFVFFFPVIAHAQINQGNWLAGGVISGFYQQSEIFYNQSREESTTTDINMIGQVAYFPLNKLAVGINAQHGVITEKVNLLSNGFGGSDQSYTLTNKLWMAGPFVRYYCLPASNKFNFYVQGSYQFGVSDEDLNSLFIWTDGEGGGINDIRAFQASVAPVLMLNQHISLEFILAYARIKQLNDIGNTNKFSGGVGLQVHLGKPKKD